MATFWEIPPTPPLSPPPFLSPAIDYRVLGFSYPRLPFSLSYREYPLIMLRRERGREETEEDKKRTKGEEEEKM